MWRKEMVRKFWRITNSNHNAPPRRMRRQRRPTKFLLMSPQKFNKPNERVKIILKGKNSSEKLTINDHKQKFADCLLEAAL